MNRSNAPPGFHRSTCVAMGIDAPVIASAVAKDQVNSMMTNVEFRPKFGGIQVIAINGFGA